MNEGVLLTVAYEGGPFAGWAPQKNAVTAAGTLLTAIRKIRPSVIEVRGASRTDSGVHARGQRVAFDAPPGVPSRGWALGLAAHLPPTISVRSVAKTEAGFVPRFHALRKRYVYTILQDLLRDPFHEAHSWRVVAKLDLETMRRAAGPLLGTHDFRAFRASADARLDTTRTMHRIDVNVDPSDTRLLRVIVEGDHFLYNMVRILAGTLVDVGAGRLDPEVCKAALVSGDRTLLGQTAPACGLLLDEVQLDREGEDPWPA